MNNSFTIARRDFLKISAGLSLAVGMAGTSSLRGAAIPNQRWVTAIRDGHLKATGKLDCWAALKALDVTGVEVVLTEALLCPGLYGADNPYTVATDDGIKRLKDDLAAHGATITAFAMFNRLDERLEVANALGAIAQFLQGALDPLDGVRLVELRRLLGAEPLRQILVAQVIRQADLQIA